MLGSPLVVVRVVPFVIGLGVVRLGPGHIVRLLAAETLFSVPCFYVLTRIAQKASTLSGGGGISGGSLSVAPADTVILVGGGLAVHVLVTGVILVVVLSLLLISSSHTSAIALVVVRLGRNVVVRLAPSGVEIGAHGLLSLLVVVVLTRGGGVRVGGSLPGGVSLTVASLGGLGLDTVGTVSLAAVALAVTGIFAPSIGFAVSGVATVRFAVRAVLAMSMSTVTTLSVSLVADSGGLGTERGSTVDISVLAPSLSTPLVEVLVVPFIVGLSRVSLSTGSIVRNFLIVVLVSVVCVPVGTVAFGGGLLVLASLRVGPATVATSVVEILGGSIAVRVLIATVTFIVVFEPLVALCLNTSSVVLVFVVFGINGVVGLAPPGVVVRAVCLLDPYIVVIGTVGLHSLPGSSTLLGLTIALASHTLATVGTTVGTTGLVATVLFALSTVSISVTIGGSVRL